MCHRLEQHAIKSDDHAAAGPLVAEIKSEFAALLATFAEARLGTPDGKRGAA
jgi:hypothetical protein